MTIFNLYFESQCMYAIADDAADWGDYQTANNAARCGEQLEEELEAFFDEQE